MKTGKVLIIDDDPDILTAATLLLKRAVKSVRSCTHPSSIPQLLSEDDYDVILLDMNFGPGESDGHQGLSWLEQIIKLDPQAIVILITAHSEVSLAVNAMKIGATDFIAKPWQNEKLLATVSTAIKLRRSRSEVQLLKNTNKVLTQASSEQPNPLIWGVSSAMSGVKNIIDRAAPTDANVLILGENGTGKELIAREIHKRSLRSDKVFMTVDLGTISESLFESELFGHQKGAFTGAVDDRVGRLQAANGGTLFLDELGNLQLNLQSRLLTALEQRTITPVGSNKAIAIDVRVVAATNMSLAKLSNPDYFRQDLLFRLNTVELHIPSLRERRDDIPKLLSHFIALYCQKHRKPLKQLTDNALDSLVHYSWPGNVRALRHSIERAVILSDSDKLTEVDFQINNAQVPLNFIDTRTSSENLSPTMDKELNLEKIEKQAISSALKQHGYNISHAAKTLGLTRAALYRRMEKYGL